MNPAVASPRMASLASRLLVFRGDKAQGKPENIRNVNGWCPFCHPEQLTDIFRCEGDLIWLMNKYRTIEDTVQTIIVESADHVGDPSNYRADEMRRIMRFSVECWHEMRRHGTYDDVLMFKNFGPLSGGSLRHPHLQIVGLKRGAGIPRPIETLLSGVEVWSSSRARALVAAHPLVGPDEVTLVAQDVHDPASLDELADLLRAAVTYVLSTYRGGRCGSYNLFFYEDEAAWRDSVTCDAVQNGDQQRTTAGSGANIASIDMGEPAGTTAAPARIVCRVVPRWPVSPYQIGYGITQVSSAAELSRIAAELRPYILHAMEE